MNKETVTKVIETLASRAKQKALQTDDSETKAIQLGATVAYETCLVLINSIK